MNGFHFLKTLEGYSDEQTRKDHNGRNAVVNSKDENISPNLKNGYLSDFFQNN